MSDLVLIVTRHGDGEWDPIWAVGNNDSSLIRYDIHGVVINAGDQINAALMVMNGLKVDDLKIFESSINPLLKNIHVYSVVHGENEEIKRIFSLSPATYSLGNDNQPVDGSLGDFVVKLATTIKEKKGDDEFKKSLEALKSAIRGDRLSKAMSSFLEALSPLSLTQDQPIKDRVSKDLDDLDAGVKNDLRAIFTNMSTELSGLAGNIGSLEQMTKVVDWAIQDDSTLKFLARRYL